MKWYQTVPAYLLLAVIEFQAFDLVREGMSMISFFVVTMLVLIGMMSLSAPPKFRTVARRLLTIASCGPSLLFLIHLYQIIRRGIGLGLGDVPTVVLLLLPSAALLVLSRLVLRRPAESA